MLPIVLEAPKEVITLHKEEFSLESWLGRFRMSRGMELAMLSLLGVWENAL